LFFILLHVFSFATQFLSSNFNFVFPTWYQTAQKKTTPLKSTSSFTAVFRPFLHYVVTIFASEVTPYFWSLICETTGQYDPQYHSRDCASEGGAYDNIWI
jgi:hypothetical protein